MSTKNGRLPVSQKPRGNAPISLSDIFGNPLEVSQSIADTLKAKGLTWRWVDYRKLVDNGGHHERGWAPIKAKECGMTETSVFGGDADGYVRRGTLVLAVRPKAMSDKHRAYLRQEADRYSKVQARHASELRQHAKDAGIGMTVSEGYGEESESGE